MRIGLGGVLSVVSVGFVSVGFRLGDAVFRPCFLVAGCFLPRFQPWFGPVLPGFPGRLGPSLNPARGVFGSVLFMFRFRPLTTCLYLFRP